jgi:hypothetical protein
MLQAQRSAQLIGPGQFEHRLRLMEAVGRLLGVWLKQARATTGGSSTIVLPEVRSLSSAA